jgi:AcrR family transcriptional regulator
MSSAGPGGSTRELLLDAAASLLVEPGDDELSLGRVAQRAGVSRQALYLHFASRAALIIATVEHINQSLGLEDRIRAIRQAADGSAALEHAMSTICWHNDRAGPALMALGRLIASDPEAAAAWQGRGAGRRSLLLEVTKRLGQEGKLRDGLDAAAAADLLSAIAHPVLLHELVTRRRWSRRRATAELVRLACIAVTPSARPRRHS